MQKLKLPKPAPKTVTVKLPEGEVLGVDVSTIQDIEINDTKVTGNSKFVENFSQFEKDAKGNFLAIKCDEATKGETINWELSDYQKVGSGTLDEDGILVVKLHSNTQKITLHNGETSKVLDLTGVTLDEG